MKYAQAVQSEQADQHRLPAPVFQIGDEVWLLRRHIHTTRPSSKLDFKRLRRFRILEKISSHAYKLDLPASMKCHPVFYVSLFKPAAIDPLKGQKRPQPPPIIVDDEQEWEVEEIVDSKIVRRNLKNLVRWVGHDELTWEPANLLKNVPLLVQHFHTQYTAKPKPDHAIWVSAVPSAIQMLFRKVVPLKTRSWSPTT